MFKNSIEINEIIIIAPSDEVDFACPVVAPGNFILKKFYSIDL